MGDINADGEVDMTLHECQQHLPYTANAGTTGDDKVDISDLARACANLGWHISRTHFEVMVVCVVRYDVFMRLSCVFLSIRKREGGLLVG